MDTKEARGTDHVLTFRTGDTNCALQLGSVQEIVPLPALIQVPGQPRILEGFLNLRGTMVPVLSLGKLLGGDCADDAYAPILIVLVSDSTLALLVDDVLDATALTNA